MNFLFPIFIWCFYSLNSFAEIQIESTQNKTFASEQINYVFQLKDDKTLTSISEKDLVETHTKILHLVVYDLSLNEFNHVHPEYDGVHWSVDLNLLVNGRYFVWAQGKTTSGHEFYTYRFLDIENGKIENPVVSLGDERIGEDGSTQIKLADTKIKSGKMTMLEFTISHTDGTWPILSPYLGAFAHVIATPLYGNELIHVHPMAGKNKNSGMLHVTFPTAGEYRLWIQLVDQNVLKTIPLSVQVQ